MNKSSNRYNADANCMRLFATVGLKEKRSFLEKFKEGVRRQSSASLYGEKYQFNFEI